MKKNAKVIINGTVFSLNKKEQRALYAILNYTHNSILLGFTLSDKMKDALGRENYIKKGLIANGITYEEFYK